MKGEKNMRSTIGAKIVLASAVTAAFFVAALPANSEEVRPDWANLVQKATTQDIYVPNDTTWVIQGDEDLDIIDGGAKRIRFGGNGKVVLDGTTRYFAKLHSDSTTCEIIKRGTTTTTHEGSGRSFTSYKGTLTIAEGTFVQAVYYPVSGNSGAHIRVKDGATLKIDGRGFDAPDEPYVRIPVRFEGKVPKAVFEMGRQSTGMSIRFKTTSRKLVVRWTLVPRPWTDPLIPPSGLQSVALWAKGDGDWEYVKKAHPAQDGVNELLVEDWEPGRTGLLYLPMRGEVKKLEIGFEKGAAFEALPPAAPGRIVHYGTSIVHGGCVSQPGMMFTSFMGRILDREVVNLGFSGNGRMEPEMADLLAEIDAALYIVDCDWNMTVDLQKKNYEPFVRKLHALRPETPILLCGGCTTRHAPREQEVFAKSVYDKLKAEDPSGWKDLHFLSGVGQLPFDSFATHDHVHPNDYGAPFMGKAYAAAVERILR